MPLAAGAASDIARPRARTAASPSRGSSASAATNPANSQDEVLTATYRGIYRSVDGGGSWSQVIASDSGYTDVAVTSGGAMYAITRTGSLIRVWRSTNGTAWTLIQPASFPTAANRIVIGLAPSNAQIAYFFALREAPISRVALITSMEVFITIFLGVFFLRRHESLTPAVFVAAVLGFLGTAAIILY